MKDAGKVFKIIDTLLKSKGLQVTSVLTTGLSGVDKIAEMWAARKGLKARAYLPACETFHEEARNKRDDQMIAHAGRLILIYEVMTEDLKDILAKAKKAKLEIFEVEVEGK